MVSYHQSRIDHSHIPNPRASFKAYDAACERNNITTPKRDSVYDASLSVLREILFDHDANDTSALGRHSRLVIASYNLRRTKSVEEVLHSSSTATTKSKSLWLDICMLARLRVAFQVFQEITVTLPSFKQVTIILIPCPHTPAHPSQRPLSLKQTYDLLKLDLDASKTKAILGTSWTVTRTEREFTKRQGQKPNVHAEVQLLIFLDANGSFKSGLFPYFGCSKLSCFMCDRFIRSYRRIATRGCHGRLSKPWTVPDLVQLLPGQADRTARALAFVQKEVKKKLKESVRGQIRHERTSVAGGSSVLGGRREAPSERQLQIDRLRMETERDRVAELFRR